MSGIPETKEALCRLAGCPEQLYGITRMTLEEGRGRGMAVYDLETGGGLRCTVLADNGLDIGRLTYRGVPVSFLSKNGIVSPYAHHPFEEEFLHTFPGGMLYTCGLLSAGPAGRDGGVWHPLHGRYHSIPADQCAGTEENGCLKITGRVRETQLFGHALELRRTIEAPVGGSELCIIDTLENQTPEPIEYMVLYHMNFGYPFLSPALRLVLPDGTTTTPRNEDAAAGLGRERTFCAPVDGAAEQVFFHKVPGEDGFGQVRAENPELGFGAEVCWSLGSLPVLAQWKCMRSGEYVLGIEPSNSYIMGRAAERENGTIGHLAPFESRRMEVRLRFYPL
ncbi:MAG: aldose 1-epimerase family protein [Acutalibacteraceae bacterium]